MLKTIWSLDISKAHGHDDLSARMIKLSIIHRNCLANSSYPDPRKKSNIYPIHKKNDKQIIKNYRPISVMPVGGKIFLATSIQLV